MALNFPARDLIGKFERHDLEMEQVSKLENSPPAEGFVIDIHSHYQSRNGHSICRLQVLFYSWFVANYFVACTRVKQSGRNKPGNAGLIWSKFRKFRNPAKYSHSLEYDTYLMFGKVKWVITLAFDIICLLTWASTIRGEYVISKYTPRCNTKYN